MNKIYLTFTSNFLKCLLFLVLITGVEKGWGQTTYNLITSTLDLTAGAKYLVVNSQNNGSGFALGYQNTNNRPQAAINIAALAITATPAVANSNITSVFELTLGGISGAWTLNDAANTTSLQAPSNTSNILKAGSGLWTISFVAGAAVITSTNGGTNNTIKYNAGANLFSCYSSGQSPVYLYKANTGCMSSTTVTNFLPTAGPAGTRVTITGSGFVPTSTVKFGNILATSSNYINPTTIIATVPAGLAITSAFSVSNAAACYSSVYGSFTFLSNTGSCAAVFSDLIISEINDPFSGNDHNIEIYNGTSSAINLDAPNDYKLQVFNVPGLPIDIDIIGNIAPGEVKVYYTGANGGYSGPALGTQLSAGSGFNDNDIISLLKNGSIIDVVNCPNEIGFNFRRVATVIGPNSTYTAAEWIFSSTESTTDLGFYSGTGTTINFNTQPADQGCNFLMTVTTLGSPTTYQWKYYNANTNTWDNVTNTALSPAIVAGATTSNLQITGDISGLHLLQFYCEIGKSGCSKISNAAQVNNSKAFYRSKLTGDYTNATTWEYADATTGPWGDACTYPTATNSAEVFIINTHKVTLNTNTTINIDKITINNGGELEVGSTAKFVFLNTNANADLIINGILTDRATSGNGIDYEDNSGTTNDATWQLGTAGTVIKTNTSSAAKYRDFYEGGIVNMPTGLAGAKFIYRYDAAATTPTVVAANMIYPNLYFENTTAIPYSFNTSFSALQGGISSFCTVQGSMYVGTTGTAGVTVANNSINTSNLFLVKGSLIIGAGSILTNQSYNGTSTASYGFGTGFEVRGGMEVYGNFSLNNNNIGKLLLSGNSQIIGGSNTIANNMNVQDFEINANSIITNKKDFNIFGVHTFGNAAKLNVGSGNITLISNSVGTAQVAPIPSNAVISYSTTGRFIIERFIPPGRKWRFLAVPATTTQTVREAWMENAANIGSNPKPGYGTIVTDEKTTALANGFDAQSISGPSLKFFSGITNNYIGINSPADLVNSQPAYMAFVRGDRSCLPSNSSISNTVLRTTGQLKTQLQTTNGIPIGEFVAIGNPYASRINLKSIYAASSISPNIYVWDPKLTGGYGLGGFQTLSYFDATNGFIIVPGGGSYPVGGPGVFMNTIESGQAFFVRAGASVGAININETDKTIGSANVFGRVGEMQPPAMLGVSLHLIDAADNSNLLDGVAVLFNENENNEVDYNDAKKLTNTSENVSIKNATKLLAIERKQFPINNDTIQLNITGLRVANYQWKLNLDNINAEGRDVIFIDRFLQTSTTLNLLQNNFIHFNVTNEAATYAANRFLIVFKQTPAPFFVQVNTAVTNSKNISINWAVANENFVANYSIERSKNNIDFVSIQTTPALQNNSSSAFYTTIDAAPLVSDNYYRIKLTTLAGNILYSNTVKVNKLNDNIGLSLSPTIVTNSEINIVFQNQPSGTYNYSILNMLGQSIQNGEMKVNGFEEVKKIQLYNLAKGLYNFVISGANNKKSTLKFTNL